MGKIFPIVGSLQSIHDILQQILDDLPEPTTPGRSGLEAQPPTVARVCRTSTQIRHDLHHLREEMPKDKFNNVCSKYKALPELYYGGDTSKAIGPNLLQNVLQNVLQSMNFCRSRTFGRTLLLCSKDHFKYLLYLF